jgi:hypothetical protein
LLAPLTPHSVEVDNGGFGARNTARRRILRRDPNAYPLDEPTQLAQVVTQ